MVLLDCAKSTGDALKGNRPKDKSKDLEAIRPAIKDETTEPIVVPVLGSCIQSMSNLRIRVPKDLRDLSQRQASMKIVQEALRRNPDMKDFIMDPSIAMNIKDVSFAQLVNVSVGNI